MGTALRVSPSRPSLAQEESIPSLFSWVFAETWLLCPETLSVTDVNDQMGLRVLTIVGNGS